MNPYHEINTAPSRSDLFKFGLTLLIAFPLLGALLLVLGTASVTALVWLSAVGVTVFGLSFVEVLAIPLYILWMGLGITLGLIVQPLVLALMYTLLIVPLGLLFKVLGRDPMKRKLLESSQGSYWGECTEIRNTSRYFRQF